MYFRVLPPSLHSATMKLRILIVDDSETTRRILRAIVHSREWTVCGEAESGQAGIAKFGELKPDLVLIDLAMPDMNGLEAARNMAALDSNTPLVLFTVLDMPALVEPARCWNSRGRFESASLEPCKHDRTRGCQSLDAGFRSLDSPVLALARRESTCSGVLSIRLESGCTR